MDWVEVTTQKELDAAVKAGEGVILRQGFWKLYGQAQAKLYDQAQAKLCGQAQATLYDQAQAKLYDQAQATLYDQAQATLYDQAQATLCGQAQGRVFDRSTVRCGPKVAVHRHSRLAVVEGGTVIDALPPATVEEWLDSYGLEAHDGVVVLFKTVRKDWRSGHGFDYTPGTIPVASDWDGGKRECGGGLHFSPRPWMARQFDSEATLFVGCPVRLEDIRPPREDDAYPAKVKAQGCCGPLFQVDEDGNRMEET